MFLTPDAMLGCWQSEDVSVAALAALRPPESVVAPAAPAVPAVVTNLDWTARTTLQLITLRAQRPLYLTAGKFAYLTLVLYLQVSSDRLNVNIQFKV